MSVRREKRRRAIAGVIGRRKRSGGGEKVESMKKEGKN